MDLVAINYFFLLGFLVSIWHDIFRVILQLDINFFNDSVVSNASDLRVVIKESGFPMLLVEVSEVVDQSLNRYHWGEFGKVSESVFAVDVECSLNKAFTKHIELCLFHMRILPFSVD